MFIESTLLANTFVYTTRRIESYHMTMRRMKGMLSLVKIGLNWEDFMSLSWERVFETFCRNTIHYIADNNEEKAVELLQLLTDSCSGERRTFAAPVEAYFTYIMNTVHSNKHLVSAYGRNERLKNRFHIPF